MNTTKNVNIDLLVLWVLPIILGIAWFILPDKVVGFAMGIGIGIACYLILVYEKRYVYGISGLGYLAVPSIMFVSFTLLIGLPSIYIAATKDHPAVYPYHFSVLSFYFLFPIGLRIGGLLWPINYQLVVRLKQGGFRQSKVDLVMFEVLIWLFVVSISIFALYLIRVKTIPLVEMIQHPGEYLHLKMLREEAFKLLPVTFIEKYIFLWQRSIFAPVGIIASLFLFTLYKKRKYFILFLLFLLTGLIFNSLTLEKSPSAAIFLAIIAFYYLRQQKLSLSFLLISVLLVFLIPALILLFLHYQRENIFSLIIISILNRVFIVPAEALYYHFEIFPQHHDFLLGRSTHFTSWLYADGYFPLANFVAKYWWRSPHTTGFVNANYLGNFWADFGIVGVILSTPILGILTHWMFQKILTLSQYQKSAYFVIFATVTLPIFTFNFTGSNFTTLFFSRGLIVLLILFLFVESFSRTVNSIVSTKLSHK